MEQVNLVKADSSKVRYDRGMFVDFGIQFPLGDGYGCPVINFYVVTKENPARIEKVKVTSEDGTPPSYDFVMIFDKRDTHSISVAFDKNEGVNIGEIVLQKDIPDEILLQQAQSRRAYSTHDMHGGQGQISEPELIKNVIAYVSQSTCYSSKEVSGNLLYFEEATKENAVQAIKDITQKSPNLIQMSDRDISKIVNALFAGKVRSAHEGEGFVDNKVFRNAA